MNRLHCYCLSCSSHTFAEMLHHMHACRVVHLGTVDLLTSPRFCKLAAASEILDSHTGQQNLSIFAQTLLGFHRLEMLLSGLQQHMVVQMQTFIQACRVSHA